MGLGSFFKKLPGRIWQGAKVVVPLASMLGIPIPALPLIKAGMLIAEQRGGKQKMEVALEEILPALEQAGIELPVRKVRLAIELMLDPETNGLPGENSVWTFEADKEK
jgi:hypothetical protein